MPLETASYISDLVTSNPAASDGMNNADDHMRLIKAVVKTSFPNVSGAVTATYTELNGAAALFVNGAGVLADAGAMFKTNSTDGFKNPLSGDIDVYLQGAVAATWSRSLNVNTYTVNGKFVATGEIKGPGVPQPGATMIWWDDVLPTDGLWAFANGQIISNANNVCPILLARWGSRFGGNGVTTMGLPNLQEVVPVGKSGMGGAASPGLLTSIAAGVKDVLNAIFGADTVALLTAHLPSHTHAVYLKDNGHTHTYDRPNINGASGASGTVLGDKTPGTPTGSSTTGITIGSVNGVANDNSTAATGSGSAHSNLQPSKVVNWIIRLG